MKEPIVYEKREYPLYELTDEEFEELCYYLLEYSPTLKEKIGYTKAFYKVGGKDKGKDGIIYSNKKEIGITQSKHTKRFKSSMKSNVITDEILKMLLNIFVYKSEIKKYVFFVSSHVTEEISEMLINFTDKFLSLSTTEEKIKKIINKFASFKNNPELKKMSPTEIKRKLIEICRSIDMNFFYNTDIQVFLLECPLIIIEKYFSIKKVIVEKETYEVPLIEENELKDFIDDNNYLYRNGRYKEKLIEIDVEDFYLEEATKDLYEKYLAVIKLHKIVPNDLKAIMREYEKHLLSAEKHARGKYTENISSKKYSSKEGGRKYYINFMEELSSEKIKIEIRDFRYVTPTFAKGTVQELVNDNEIEDWLIKRKQGGK